MRDNGDRIRLPKRNAMKENIQMLLTLCLFGYIIFMQQCSPSVSDHRSDRPRIDTIVRIDTTLPPPIVINLPRQKVPNPVIVYVDSSGQSVPVAEIDTQQHIAAQQYQDSIEDENLTLYYKSTVEGRLLANALDYKLKIPQLITKTIEITKPYPIPVSQVLLTGGIGGKLNQFSSITVGLQFVSAKGWALGYDYDILEKSHNVKLGIKLFQIKPKIK